MTDSCQSRLIHFQKEFNARHDFNHEDIKNLERRYPQASFINIPQAWIISIDQMLEDIFEFGPDLYVRVSQRFGFLDVEFVPNDYNIRYCYDPLVKGCERDIYFIDIDLHEALGYEPWWKIVA